MRYGIVTTSYPRDADDPAGNFVMGHARWLVAAGHQVHVIAAGPSDCGQGWDKDIAITRVPSNLFYTGGAPEALTGASRRWLDAARFSATLATTIRQHAANWDGVFAHWLAPSAVAAAIAAPRLPLLGIAHSGDVHLLRRLHLVTPTALLLRRRRASLAFVSEQLRSLFLDGLSASLRQTLARRSGVCSMGIDVARFSAIDVSQRPHQPPVVLFLGRLVPVKGIDVLIEAMAGLAVAGQLCVAGAGPQQQALADLASRHNVRVDFVGEVRGRERDELLARASVLVLPSIHVDGERTEGLPVTALEAMAAGVPVIASAVGGLAELPANSLRLVPPGDPAVLAKAIGHLLANPDVSAQQTAHAHALVHDYDWSKVGPMLLNMFHRREK